MNKPCSRPITAVLAVVPGAQIGLAFVFCGHDPANTHNTESAMNSERSDTESSKMCNLVK